MAYTQEDFQEWIFFISDKLDYMTDTFAKENGLNLDLFYDHINKTQPMYIPKGAVVIGE